MKLYATTTTTLERETYEDGTEIVVRGTYALEVDPETGEGLARLLEVELDVTPVDGPGFPPKALRLEVDHWRDALAAVARNLP